MVVNDDVVGQVRVPGVLQGLQLALGAARAQQQAHGREAVRVRAVPAAVQLRLLPSRAPPPAHRREEVPVRRVRQG